MTADVSSIPLEEKARGGRFGTFLGVYLPTLLPTLGVILFLRMGFFLGTASLPLVLGLIALSASITLITCFSISSAATNMRMGEGGVYYVLSRTFGLEVGSATCLPLYLAQTLSIAFYIMGFTESLQFFYPEASGLVISMGTLGGLTALSLISTLTSLRVAFAILIMIGLALFSFFMGDGRGVTMGAEMPTSLGFWALFALFFPALTGIEVGVALSNRLKSPSKSIPFGIISAVSTGCLIYFTVALFLSKQVSHEALTSNSLLMVHVARYKGLIWLGIWGATLSGALSNMMGAPRMLAAISKDRIFPSQFAKGGDTPVLATCITAIIASSALIGGSLEKIAPLLSMFFLIAYGMLNLTTGVEALLQNPSWRPSFSVHPFVSLFGAALIFVVILMMDAGFALTAIALLLGIYLIMKKRAISSNWDDIRHSILVFITRFATYRLARSKPSAKSWRPNLLVFIGDPFLRSHLIAFTKALTHGKGFLTMASIIDHEMEAKKELYKENIKLFFEQSRIPSLVEVHHCESVMTGMKRLIENYSIGPIKPNTIVLGATQKPEHFSLLAKVIKVTRQEARNVILVKENKIDDLHYPKKGENKRIDVWWGGRSRFNSELILVIAYMLQTSEEWKGAKVYLKTVITDPEKAEKAKADLEAFALKRRLHIIPEIAVHQKGDRLFEETITQSSHEADLIFLGLRAPEEGEKTEIYASYYADMLEKTKHMPPVAFVLTGEQLDFSHILD